MLKKTAKELIEKIEYILERQADDSRLPENTYYLDNGYILCCPGGNADCRFPYACDGYTLWAHSSGRIQAKDGLFNVFKPLYDMPAPSAAFFAEVPYEDGYFPVALMGNTKQLYEPFAVRRYVVYSLSAAYYIADTDFAVFALRADMSAKKEIRFSFEVINKKPEPLKLVLTYYFEALLLSGEHDNMWSITDGRAKRMKNGSFILSRSGADAHDLIINRRLSGAEAENTYYTTARSDFVGSAAGDIINAKALRTGRLEKQTEVSAAAAPMAAELIHVTVKDSARLDVVMPINHVNGMAENYVSDVIDTEAVDKEIEDRQISEEKRIGRLDIRLGSLSSGKINADVLNSFIKTVQKQVDVCAMGRYYVEDLLGIRDVFQQLEQAMLWDSLQAREKILRAVSFIDPSGEAPRQFSIPKSPDEIPKMDLREFIDQGNWIISCVYSYLAWTNDYSVLDEVCGYYERQEDGTVRLSKLRDSLLEHLIKIADFLESNIDTEDGTNCLRALYGDWNDAIDGMGKTEEKGKKYGTGVSVMASLHFYQNLKEMSEILNAADYDRDRAAHYMDVREALGQGLVENAVETNGCGEVRLIHGWGDHKSYRIGSFCDSDGEPRISFAPSAFWVTSGLIEKTPELKSVIIDTFKKLDSRFGIRTLTPAFTPESYGVGRIAGMLKGTAENDCAYVHASMFSILSLFYLGEAECAWRQLEKSMVISHDFVTKPPFVMSNSYLDNPEFSLNGQSAIDWYTGAGTVMIKNFVRGLMGIIPDLNGVTIRTAPKMPCLELNATIQLKGNRIKFEYRNESTGERRIYLDGKQLETKYDELMNNVTAYVLTDNLHDGSVIEVLD